MRALVLSGGGSNGAYHVGAIQALLDESNPYDLYCGVSVGALVAAHMSQYPDGEEINAVEELADMFLNIETRDIYKPWFFFGKLQSLFRKSLYNSKPLTKLVRKNFLPWRTLEANKKLSVGAVSLSSGNYRVFTEAEDCIVKAVVASASFPIMFSPVDIDDQMWSDGGVREITPVDAAIARGATEIDFIICTPPSIEQNKAPGSTISVAMRTLEVLMDEIVQTDVDNLTRMYPGIKFRAWRNKSDIVEDSLQFNTDEAQELYLHGYFDVLKNPGGNFTPRRVHT